MSFLRGRGMLAKSKSEPDPCAVLKKIIKQKSSTIERIDHDFRTVERRLRKTLAQNGRIHDHYKPYMNLLVELLEERQGFLDDPARPGNQVSSSSLIKFMKDYVIGCYVE